MSKECRKSKYKQQCEQNIYNLFNITDEQRTLFQRMAVEWATDGEKGTIRSYNLEPINTEVKGIYNA